jgi:hypothetical protein
MADSFVLVGVSEIAEMLGVSEQRASVPCARKGFPDPVERVAPIADTVEIMRDLFSDHGTVSFDEAVEALQSHAFPSRPRQEAVAARRSRWMGGTTGTDPADRR